MGVELILILVIAVGIAANFLIWILELKAKKITTFIVYIIGTFFVAIATAGNYKMVAAGLMASLLISLALNTFLKVPSFGEVIRGAFRGFHKK